MIAASLVSGLGQRTGTTEDPGSRATAAAPSTSATETETEPASTPTPPAATETTEPSPSAEEPGAGDEQEDQEGQGAPSSAELAQAITDYYALMPGNLDQAWERMTPAYQRNTAGGRKAYEKFWKDVDRVTVGDVRGTPPNRAQATVTYEFKKQNRVVREVTAYQLVRQGGLLKINSSTVLSSSGG